MDATLPLHGKRALVTGGSRGIGLAFARTLAAAGCDVVINHFADEARAGAEARALARESGTKIHPLAADVGDPAAARAMVRAAGELLGGLDILVSNAGITRDQLMLRMKRSDWDDVLATNLTAAFVLCQAAMKPMIKQRSGRIVAISSVVGQMGNAGQANYAASKAGLIGFCKSLAREVGSRHVTVNVVAPGFVETDMTKVVAEETQKQWAAQIPLGRLGTPDDIASAVCFLASDEASYITGQVLAVNGGMYT